MIPRLSDILYTTDLSKNSAFAFRYAVNSARKHNARTHILHVIESMPPGTEGLLSLYLEPEKLEKIKQETRGHLIQKIKDRLEEWRGAS